MVDNNHKNKEEYEIDPNSAYNRLKKLQSTLKEEQSLIDIFYENRDILLKRIDDNCLKYFKNKVKIQEIFDHNTYSNLKNYEKLDYVLSEKPSAEFPQCYDPLNKLLFYFRESNEMTLKLIENCPKEKYEQLANFLCNFFYVNIFSSTFLDEYLLTLIFHLIEKDVSLLQSEKSLSSFLDSSISFTAILLKCLSRRDEIKSYLENILKNLLIQTAGLFSSHKNIMFVGLESNKIKQFMREKNYNLRKTDKKCETFSELLTENIKCSALNNINSSIQKKKIKNNNFFVKSTKETFENLLLGNESDNEDEENEDDSKQLQMMDKLILGNLNKNKKKKGTSDDIETFFINSGYYMKPPSKNNEDTDENETDKEKDKQKQININPFYTRPLSKSALFEFLEASPNPDLEDYALRQINEASAEESFTVHKFVNETIKEERYTVERLTAFFLIFKYHFESLRSFIDELFVSLIENKDRVPYMICCVCTIIARLISVKFPQMTNIQKMGFVSSFFFQNLIFPILMNPKFNGIMMLDFPKEKERYMIIIAMTKIIKKLLKGKFFDSNLSNEIYLTIFNGYFLEIMPHVIKFFNNISNVKLPENIERLIEITEFLSSLRNQQESIERNTKIDLLLEEKHKLLEFNYLEKHPEERLYHQSICLNYLDIQTIYEIIKSNDEYIVGNKDGIIYKTYKKLTFHEALIKSKIENDEKNKRRTYLFLTKLVMNDNMKEKINSKKTKKFSFQTTETLSQADKEKFILERVKYCISTIIKNLNDLSGNNFYDDDTEKGDNFVKGLNKMIEMEGFSEMLKEKTLPLDWFGLYLQSNIENIPAEYKRNNFGLLYNELIDEGQKHLKEIQSDNSLNTLYSKVTNSEKMIDICDNSLKRIFNNDKKFEIFNFILNAMIPVSMIIKKKLDDGQICGIKFILEIDSDSYIMESYFQPKDDDCYIFTSDIKCTNIIEICSKFPSFNNQNITEIIELQEEIKLGQSLEMLFNIVYDFINNAEKFKNYEPSEKFQIKRQIENFIHSQIYSKIYSYMPDEKDIIIYQNSMKLNWVTAEMIDKSLSQFDEKMSELMKIFIKNMDDDMCPINKLRDFERVLIMVDNLILFRSFPVSSADSLLIFVFLRSQSSRLHSNLRYMQMYLPSSFILGKDKGILQKFEYIVNRLVSFSEKDLIGISKDEFEKKKIDVQIV